VRVHVEGEAAPDTLIVVDHNSVPVEAEATHIPWRFGTCGWRSLTRAIVALA
jgi:hypothetical protein